MRAFLIFVLAFAGLALGAGAANAAECWEVCTPSTPCETECGWDPGKGGPVTCAEQGLSCDSGPPVCHPNYQIVSTTAIGAFESATIALTDASKEPTRVFKATKLSEDMEISAFNGGITRNAAGQLTVHAHTVVTLVRNGQVYAGHLIEGKISLTMQMLLEDSPPLAPAAAAAAR